MPKNQEVTEREKLLNRKRVKKSRDKSKARGDKEIRVTVPTSYYDAWERMVEAKADDYPLELDQRSRKAKAKTTVFMNSADGVMTTFITMEDQQEKDKAEIRALSPSYFKADLPVKVVPNVIKELEDDPVKLKNSLARIYSEALTAKKQLLQLQDELKHAKRSLSRYQEINDQLQAQLDADNDSDF